MVSRNTSNSLPFPRTDSESMNNKRLLTTSLKKCPHRTVCPTAKFSSIQSCKVDLWMGSRPSSGQRKCPRPTPTDFLVLMCMQSSLYDFGAPKTEKHQFVHSILEPHEVSLGCFCNFAKKSLYKLTLSCPTLRLISLLRCGS